MARAGAGSLAHRAGRGPWSPPPGFSTMVKPIRSDAPTPIPQRHEPSRDARPSLEDRAAAELGRAVEAYKRWSGRQFPTWCEILEILRGLGYSKPKVSGPRVRINVE